MHLSNELQKKLKTINSSIELAKTIEEELPFSYAFFHPTGERNFRVSFGKNKNQFSILLFDRTEKRNHEICYLRGIFNSMDDLAKVIKNWIEDEEEIDELANSFSNLERYKFDEIKNINDEIEVRWKYVRNSIFNNSEFWKNRNWEERYFEMIDKAKRKEEWKDYYPFTSHDMLRFSLDNEIKYTWVLSLNIIPSRDITKGNYKVSVPKEETNEEYYFDKLEDAIEFYDMRLKENQPVRWT